MIWEIAKAHPITTLIILYLICGAIGDIGRLIAPKNPVLSRIFIVFSSLFTSILGVLATVAAPGSRLSKMAPPLDSGAPTVEVPKQSLPDIKEVESLPPNTLLSKKDESAKASPLFLLEAMMIAIVIFAVASFQGCSGYTSTAVKAGNYDMELENCLKTSTSCQQYVTCRKSVADKYARPFSGSCASDAGVDQ